MRSIVFLMTGLLIVFISACSDQDELAGRIVGDVTLFNIQGDTIEQQDGVEVQAINSQGTYTTTTNSEGKFFMSMPPGEYIFKLSKEGFGGITDFTFINSIEIDSMFFLELAEAPPALMTISPAFGTYGHLVFITGERVIEDHYLIGSYFFLSSSPDVSSDKHENVWSRCCNGISLYENSQVGVKNEDLLEMGYQAGDILYVTHYPANYRRMYYYDPFDQEADPRFFTSLGKQSNVIQIIVE